MPRRDLSLYIVVGAQVTVSLRDELDVYAKQNGLTRASLIRRLLQNYVAAQKGINNIKPETKQEEQEG